jgi:hypothetical protein
MNNSSDEREILRLRNSCRGAALLRPSLPGHKHAHDLVFLSAARNARTQALFTSAFSSLTLFS